MEETEEELKAKQAKQQQQGFFDNLLNSINPLNGNGGGFSFGGIFKTLLFAVGGYFLLRNETVQNWIGGFFDEKNPDGSKKDGTGAAKLKGWIDSIAETVLGWLPESFVEALGMNKDISEQILNATPEQITDAAKDMSPELAKVLTTNYNTLAPLVVKANNGVKYTERKTAFTNDKTLYALITEQPQLAKQLVTAALKDNTNSPTDNTKAMQTTLLQSVKAIVSDKARFTVLLNDTNRANTFALMADLSTVLAESADQKMSAKQLEELFTPHLVNGVPSETLQTMVIAMLDKQLGTTPAPAADKTAQTKTPEQMAEDLKLAAQATEIGFINHFGEIEKSTAAIKKLHQTLGDEKFMQLQQVITADATQMTDAKKLGFCLTPEYKTVLKTFLNEVDISKLPAEEKLQFTRLKDALNGTPQTQAALQAFTSKGINPVDLQLFFTPRDQDGVPLRDPKDPKKLATPDTSFILYQIMSPEFKQWENAVGKENILTLIQNNVSNDLKPLATEQNMQAIKHFRDNLVAQKVSVPNAAIVSAAMLELANGNTTLMEKNSKLIADYFASNRFATAFQKMLKELQIPGKEKLFAALMNEWGTRDDGLLEVFSDPASVKMLPDVINGKINPGIGAVIAEWFVDNKLIENKDHLLAVKEAIGTPTGPAIPKATPTHLGMGVYGK